MNDTVTTPEQESTGAQGASRPLSLLAKETFGDSFHGTVKEAEPEGEQVETLEGGEDPAPEETEVEAVEQAEGEEPESETPEEGTESTEEGEELVSTFAELVEAQELDWDFVKGLKVPVNVDGETANPTFSELVKSYRTGGEADKRVEEAKTQAAALTQELTQRQQALDGQFQVAAKLIENAEKLIDQDVSQIDWNTLRQDDPAEYAARHAETKDRREQIERMKREAVESYQTLTEEQQRERAEERKKYFAQQSTALLTKLPEWQDETTATAERERIVVYLRNEGFEDQDIMGATDHRLVVMARKAMLFDERQGKASVAKKKVAKVPKVLKPGTPKPQDQINQEKRDKARERLRNSGSLDDAMALLQASRNT